MNKKKNDLKKECIICKKMVFHIEGHLLNVHQQEAEIKNILLLKPVERQRELRRLGNQGDHLYNQQVSL